MKTGRPYRRIREALPTNLRGLTGPWVKGTNGLELGGVEVKPWKTALEEFKPENQTEGLKPMFDKLKYAAPPATTTRQ